MRIVVRCHDAREARASQQLLAAAGVSAAAMAGPPRPAPDGEDITIIPALGGEADLRMAPPEHASLAVLAGLTQDAPRVTPGAGFDGALCLDAPPKLLRNQLDAYVRMAIAEEERARRARTAAQLEAPAPSPLSPRYLKVLYIGAPSPAFLSLERAISRRGGLATAAFSSYAGFDHLHDERFDAVVLNGAQDTQTAISLCAALRRNASLHHLPTLVITAPHDQTTAAAVIERGATGILPVNSPSEGPINWLFEFIARERRRRDAEHEIRALRDVMGDTRTGLFRPDPFEAHLSRLAADHHASGRALSLVALRVLPAHGARQPEENTWKRGFSEIASLAARLMRETDSGAALGGDIIIVALPAARLIAAKRTGERIASVAECTAFASGEGSVGPLVFEQNAVELQPGESGAALLARALRAFEDQSIHA